MGGAVAAAGYGPDGHDVYRDLQAAGGAGYFDVEGLGPEGLEGLDDVMLGGRF